MAGTPPPTPPAGTPPTHPGIGVLERRLGVKMPDFLYRASSSKVGCFLLWAFFAIELFYVVQDIAGVIGRTLHHIRNPGATPEAHEAHGRLWKISSWVVVGAAIFAWLMLRPALDAHPSGGTVANWYATNPLVVSLFFLPLLATMLLTTRKLWTSVGVAALFTLLPLLFALIAAPFAPERAPSPETTTAPTDHANAAPFAPERAPSPETTAAPTDHASSAKKTCTIATPCTVDVPVTGESKPIVPVPVGYHPYYLAPASSYMEHRTYDKESGMPDCKGTCPPGPGGQTTLLNKTAEPLKMGYYFLPN
ncbi:MAG: hypothetical protein WAN50_00745 [Minisyncoccia bacterium]